MDPLHVATETTISAPPDVVWRILTDFAGYARWNPVIIRLEGRPEPGTELRLKSVHVPGKPATEGVVLLRAATFPEMRWEGGHPDRAIFKGDRGFRCAPADEPCTGGTRFHQFETFSGIAAERLFAQHRARMEANFRRFNDALKRAAEG